MSSGNFRLTQPQILGRRHASPVQETTYNDPADKLWAIYLKDADKKDDEMVATLKGDADGVLIFTGLFAATVAAFIIEGYKNLLPDSGDEVVSLLSGISGQIGSLSNGTRAIPASPPPFHPPTSAIRVNTLWFISLFLSLSVALAATLMQQWSRRYLRAARRRGSPHKRGPVHIHLYHGMKTFRIEGAVELIIGLLHVAMFLFVAGLIEFLFVISPDVARAFLPFVGVSVTVYLVLSVFPFFYPTAPYDTPLTSLLRFFAVLAFTLGWWVLCFTQLIGKIVCKSIRSWWDFRIWLRRHASLDRFKAALRSTFGTRTHTLEALSASPSVPKIQYALRLTLKMLDEQWEVEEFLAGVLDFLRSPIIGGQGPPVVFYLLQDKSLVNNIHSLLESCRSQPADHPIPSLPLSLRTRRAQVVLDAYHGLLGHVAGSSVLLRIFRDGGLKNKIPTGGHLISQGWRRDAVYSPTAIYVPIARAAQGLCTDANPSIAISAACTVARCRSVLMHALLADGRNSDNSSIHPLSLDFISVILEHSLSDPTGRVWNWGKLRYKDSKFRWTSPSSRLGHQNGNAYTTRLIRRLGFLDNLISFVHHIWTLLRRRAPIANDEIVIVFDTINMLATAFRTAHVAENGILAEDGVTAFANLWTDVARRHAQGRAARRDIQREVTKTLFHRLKPIADIILRPAHSQRHASLDISQTPTFSFPDLTLAGMDSVESAAADEAGNDSPYASSDEDEMYSGRKDASVRRRCAGAQQGSCISGSITSGLPHALTTTSRPASVPEDEKDLGKESEGDQAVEVVVMSRKTEH